MIPIACGLFLGIVVGFEADLRYAAPCAVVAGGTLFMTRRMRKELRWPVLLCIVAFVVGGARCLLATESSRSAANRLDGTTGVLTGACLENETDMSSGVPFSRSLVSMEGVGLVRLVQPGEGIPYGKTVEIPVVFERPQSQRNPGGYDERLRLAKDGIFLKAIPQGPDRIVDGANTADPLVVAGSDVRDSISKVYRQILPAREASLMAGMLLGDVSGMDPKDESDFRLAGLSHLTAVSGSNVAFILAPAALLASRGRMTRRAKAASLSLYLGFFGYVTGWEASVTRAILMAAVVLLGSVLLRKADALSALASACIAMLLVDPLTAFDNGFRLSALATLGLVGLSKPIGRGLSSCIPLRADARGMRIATGTIELLAVTLAAQAAVLPVSIPMSGSLSAIGLLSNLPVVPLAGLITLYGGAAGLLGLIISFIGGAQALSSPIVHLFAEPLKGLLRFVLDVAGWAADVDFLRFRVPVATAVLFLPALFLCLLAVSMRRRDIRRTLLRSSMAMVSAALIVVVMTRWFAPDVTVVFADVGQGDLTLIVTRDGHCAIIDGGPGAEDGTGEGPSALRGLLDIYGIDRVDLAFVTHGHADHAGGILWMLQNVRCGTLVVPFGMQASADASMVSDSGGGFPGSKEGTQLSSLLLDSAIEAGIFVKESGSNDRMELGRYAAIAVLYPPPVSVPSDDAPSTDANARSLVLRIECGGFSFLVAGDADSTTEECLIADGPVSSVDLLRISHHGSAYSTTEEFLDAFAPKFAVVSVGPNLYGHPSPKTLDRLSQAGCRTFRTDLDAAVVVRVRNSIAKILEWNRKGNE
jgi:competence protein ComEC